MKTVLALVAPAQHNRFAEFQIQQIESVRLRLHRELGTRRRVGHSGEVRVAHALRLRADTRLILAFVGFPKQCATLQYSIILNSTVQYNTDLSKSKLILEVLIYLDTKLYVSAI